ncbi:MAG: aspartate aminotransferase family protein [Armatimonadetes bacterium]|nr:aspartate aminotransferase family protein [Armatimonadota bacterium]
MDTQAGSGVQTNGAKGKFRRSQTASEVIERQKKFLFPAVMTYYDTPLPIQRGEGHYVWDFDGRKYLDFFGGILTVSVGHCNPTVNAALHKQNDTLQHVSTLYPTAPNVDLAARLAELAPGDLSQTFFTNSGTEADETAVMLARMATGSHEIIALRHSYSGRSHLNTTMTAHSPYRGLPDMVAGVKHALAPYCYRCPLKLEPGTCGVACAEDLEELIRTTTTGRPAAFMAEPILGVGGFIVPPKEYFPIVADIIHKYEGLLIIDEVQTGWGRTGDKMWGIEHWGVTPDIMTMAKGAANGIPMGITMSTPEIAKKWRGLTICTFGGNPVSCEATMATIDVIEEQNLLHNCSRLGALLRKRLEGLQEKFKCIGDVRGMGLMQAVELVKDRKTKEPDAETVKKLFEATRELGMLIGKGGLYGNTLRLSPSMTITEAELNQGADILEKAFEKVAY